MKFERLLERFIRYCRIDTQSQEGSTTFPSTKKQLTLANMLCDELKQFGVHDARVTEHGYVLGTVPSTTKNAEHPCIALIAHMDTSPDFTAVSVNPLVHTAYDGKDINLSQNGSSILSVSENPYLKECVGKTIITTDGTTLLGADDKGGIAAIMSAVEYLMQNPLIPRPRIRVVFTPDEEIGLGASHISIKEIDADYGYTLDGGKVGELETETFCADSAEVLIKGVAIHPGFAKNRMVNAIKIASYIIELLPRKSLSPETTDLRDGFIHPYQMSGGCEGAAIKFLIRDFEESGLATKADLIQKIIDHASIEFPQARISLSITESYRNMKKILDQHPRVIEKASQAMQRANIKPDNSYIRGGTDGARFSFMGLPCPNIFFGGNNMHSRFEWIALEDMEKASEVVIHLATLWTE